MSSSDPLLNSAIQSHRAGRLDEARAIYQQVVDANPGRADALNLLGLTLRQLGRYAQAIDYLRRAVDVDPSQAVYYGNLAEAHRGLGQLDDAIECYQHAARLAPQLAEVHNNFGTLLQQAGRFDEAAARYATALRCDPRDAATHYNLGNLYQVQQQWDRASACFRQALACRPNYVEAQCNLGMVLRQTGRLDEALEWLTSAQALSADSVPVLSNLGVVLHDLGRLAEAQDCFERVLQLAPDGAEFHLNLSAILKDQGDPAAALAHCQRALALESTSAQALHSRGTARLALGDFAAGWTDYEQRAGCEQYDTPIFPQPRWDGSPLGRRTLLVHAEQGLGDTLQFIRYIRPVIERAPQLIVACVPELIPLLATSGIPNLVPTDRPLPPFDVYAPLMSLPYLFDTRLDTIPCDVPYLSVEPQRIEKWADYLQSYGGFKVGIVWQGRPTHRTDRLRSIPLAEFAPLARVPGVRLFSLQRGPGTEQLAALAAQAGTAGHFDVVDLGSLLDTDGFVFRDTAAAMKNMDLVITPDTGTAHLAGGLALPVWVALFVGAEWRWLRERDDSPWYPTMRLFRQRKLGDWADVFGRMADALREKAAAKQREPGP